MQKPHVVVEQLASYALQLKAKIAQLHELTSEVDAAKAQLRTAAQTLLPFGTAGSVEFSAPGGGLTVSFGDPTAEGNRSPLSPAVIADAVAAGVQVDSLVEVAEVATLSGTLVQWFREVVAYFAAQGVEIAPTWKIDRTVRLSAAGVAVLSSSASNPAAARLLQAGLRTASVSVCKE